MHSRTADIIGELTNSVESAVRTEPRILVGCTGLLFLVGLLTRGTLHLLSGATTMPSAETVQVALSLLRHGTFADAYGAGTGPTAHCMPGLPLLLAAIFRVFGSGPEGTIIASLMACAAAAFGYSLLPRLSLALGFGILPGLLAGTVGALFPVNLWSESNGAFDSSYTLLVLVVLSTVIARCWKLNSFTAREAVRVGLLDGVGCLFNLAVLPVLLAWLLAGAWWVRAAFARFLRFSAVCLFCVVAVLSPWAVRNYVTFGKVLWTRSNIGLELDLSNNDYAGPNNDYNEGTFGGGLWNHPFDSSVEREKVRFMGELAYMDSRRAHAVQWITHHPWAFVRLSAQRFLLFWFPHMVRWPQTLVESAYTVLGLIGLGFVLRSNRTSALILGLLLGGYCAIYAIVEFTPRFRDPIEPFLILLSCVLLVEMNPRFAAWGDGWAASLMTRKAASSATEQHL